MLLINCEVNLILNRYKETVISSNTLEAQSITFAITSNLQ